MLSSANAKWNREVHLEEIEKLAGKAKEGTNPKKVSHARSEPIGLALILAEPLHRHR